MIRDKIRHFVENPNVEKFIMLLIILNLLVFVLDTVSTFHSFFNNWIHRFEVVSILIFTIEYILRVITLNKLKDLFRPMMLIDLFAILPFYLEFCNINTVFLRIFRLSRLARILKIGRYSSAIDNLAKAFNDKKEELIVASSIFFICILFASILMYIFENPIQPEVFSSIPKSFYFSIITCTSVGYGDISPLSSGGKAIASILAVLGVGVHGLFVGIFSVALMNAFKNKSEE